MRLAIAIGILVVVAVGSPAAAQPSVQVRGLRGGLSEQDVSDVVHTDEAVDGCFAAARDRDRRGVDATATIKVDRTGAVTRVKLAKVPRRMKKCVTAAMRSLSFPASAEASTVTVSITTARSDESVAMSEEDAAMYANALALIGTDDSVSVGDMSRRPGADLNAQIAGSDAAVGQGTGGGSVSVGGGGSGRHTGDGDPRLPSGRITIKRTSASGALAADTVVAKILSAYFAGLKRCYKTELASDPTVKGTLALAIDIGTGGRTTAVTATGPTAACVEGLAKSWRFPARDQSTRVELDLVLVPD